MLNELLTRLRGLLEARRRFSCPHWALIPPRVRESSKVRRTIAAKVRRDLPKYCGLAGFVLIPPGLLRFGTGANNA